MSEHTPNYWSSQAEVLRAMAAKTSFPDLRVKFLGIADAYDRLAKLAEEGLARRDLPDAG